MKDWLRGWCGAQGLGFYNLGHNFERLGMLTSDGVQLTTWNKSVLVVSWLGLSVGFYTLVGRGKGSTSEKRTHT